MSNIYTKSMRHALQEARDYRDDLDIDEAKGHLSYDEWLKKVKSIKRALMVLTLTNTQSIQQNGVII